MSSANSELFTALGLFSRAVFVGDEVLALTVDQKQEAIAANGILESTLYSSTNSCSIWALLEKKIIFTSPGTLLYHDSNLRELILIAGSTIQLYERKDENSLVYTAASRHKSGTFIPTRALLVKKDGDSLLIYLGLSNQRTLVDAESSLYISKTDYKSPSHLVRMFYGYGVFNLTKNQLVIEGITPIKRKSPIIDLLYEGESHSVIVKYINHSAEQLMLTINLDQTYFLVAQQGHNIEYTDVNGNLLFPVRCPHDQTDALMISFIGSATKPEVDATRLSLGGGINLDLLTCNITNETLYHLYILGLTLSTTAAANTGYATVLQETFKDTIGFLSPDRKVLFLHNRISKTLKYTTVGELRNRVRMALSAQAIYPWSDEHRAYFDSFPIRQSNNELEKSSIKMSTREYTQYRVQLLSLVHHNTVSLSLMSLTQNSTITPTDKDTAQEEVIKAMSTKIEQLEARLEQSIKSNSAAASLQLSEMIERTQKRVDDLESMLANIHEDGILAIPDTVESISNKISTLEQREKELKNLVDLNNSLVQSKLLKVDGQIAVLDQTLDEVKSIVPVFAESFSEDEVASLESPDRVSEGADSFTNKLEAEHLMLPFDDMQFERNSVALPFCIDPSKQRETTEPDSLLTTADL